MNTFLRFVFLVALIQTKGMLFKKVQNTGGDASKNSAWEMLLQIATFGVYDIFYAHARQKKHSNPKCVQMIQYISDLGGILGLWYGFAFMTLIEMSGFVVDIVLLMVYTGAVTVLQRKPTGKSRGTSTTAC